MAALSYLGSSFNLVASRYPVATAVMTTGCKSAAADVATQTCLESRSAWDIDFRRVAVFAVFGAAYQGAGQYWIWNCLMERLPALTSHVSKVIFVNGFCDPVLFFPCFYTTKALLHTTAEHPSPLTAARVGMAEYRQNYLQDWCNTWMVWIPGHCITTVLPSHMKIPWIAAVSFGYVCLLSATRGSVQIAKERVQQTSSEVGKLARRLTRPATSAASSSSTP